MSRAIGRYTSGTLSTDQTLLMPVTQPAALEAGGLILQLVFLLALVVLSGTFSGSETALFSLTPHHLQRDAASTNPLRRLVARLMARPKRTLTIILVGNTFVNVLLFATSYVLARNLQAHLGWWVTPACAVVSVLIVLIGGEVVPKVLAVALADRLAPVSALIVHFSGFVLWPVGKVIDWVLVEPSTRLLFGPAGRAVRVEHDLSRSELKTLLEMNRQSGLLNQIENLYLREVIDLRDVRVADIMVPRVDVVAFDVNGSPEALRDLMRSDRLTKVPVYEGSIDNIVGKVYAKVAFFEPDKPLRKLVVPMRFVPEVINCEQLLEHFRSTRSQIAIVVDEFGGMAGLVSLEDVLEEIVGEIYDPEDAPQEPAIVQRSDDEYDVSGRLSVQYWAETFGIARLTDRIATVGGLVSTRLGRPPHLGDKIRVGNVELTVSAMHGRRAERLKLRLIEPSANRSGAPK